MSDSIRKGFNVHLDNENLCFLIVFAVVLLTRIPFLGVPGYGMDFDAWLVAETSERIAGELRYSVSRFPGYPFQELFYALVPGRDPFVYNFITSVFSALGAGFFCLILRKLEVKNYFWGAFALAFLPVYYINSLNAMDYVWAAAFYLGSLYFVLSKNYIAAGILLGLAAGSRITSGAFIFPYSMLVLYLEGKEGAVKKIITFAFAVLITTGLIFLPAFCEYGIGFFTFYDEAYPAFGDIIKKMTYFVWGIPGFAAFGVFFVIALINIIRKKQLSDLFRSPYSAIVIAVILYLAAYFKFPKEPEYLIPVVPFVIILLQKFLNSSQFKIFCFAAVVSSFIFSVKLGDFEVETTPLIKTNIGGMSITLSTEGPLFINRKRRIAEFDYLNEVAEKFSELPPKSIVIAGWKKNKLDLFLKGKQNSTKFVIYPAVDSLKKYQNSGYRLFYLKKAVYTGELYSKKGLTIKPLFDDDQKVID